jgi:transposase
MYHQKQTRPRALELTQNRNISFPIGTVLTAQKYYERLGLSKTFGKHKTRGVSINSLVLALVSYKLTENQSVTKASAWTNRAEVLSTFGIESFEQRTLYRPLETIGRCRFEIMADIQSALFERYEFEHTNINMDWTSIILFGTKCPIAKYGYSRDHRPDKKQITMGVSELSTPINIPIGMTVREGNINDQVHFTDTFNQVKDRLKAGSIVVMDQGANRKQNLDLIENCKLSYVTSRQLNTSDEETWIKGFDARNPKLVDAKHGTYGLKKKFPSRVNYLFFSEDLYHDQMESKLRKVERWFKEAKLIQKSLDGNRGLPKRYRINNPLIDCKYEYQTKLGLMDEAEARKILKKASVTGREGFFCLVSNMDLTLSEALTIYREKDSIEKIFNSLKNEIEIRPLRVWSEHSIYGALLIGFLAQLFISLIRFEHADLKHTSAKFIKISLMNLTVTIEYQENGSKRFILSNFNPISMVILGENREKT